MARKKYPPYDPRFDDELEIDPNSDLLSPATQLFCYLFLLCVAVYFAAHLWVWYQAGFALKH